MNDYKKFAFAHIGSKTNEVLLTPELWEKIKPKVPAIRITTVGSTLSGKEKCLALPCKYGSAGTYSIDYFEWFWKSTPNMELYIEFPLKDFS